MNNSGKTLTIFLTVISVLLVSLTVIAVFLLIKEAESRKTAECELEQVRVIEAKLQVDFKESQKRVSLLEKKEKESEERLESLMEDLELEQGLREEAKNENRELREARDILEKENLAKVNAQKELQKDLTLAEEEVISLEEQLDLASSQYKELEAQRQEVEKQYLELKDKWEPFETSFDFPTEELREELQASLDLMGMDGGIELEPIIVSSLGETKGEIISVDRETNFIIVSLGEEDGVRKDGVLAIYRGEQYLGDVKVSRVLPNMSAADFILPLKSQDVRREDRAVFR